MEPTRTGTLIATVYAWLELHTWAEGSCNAPQRRRRRRRKPGPKSEDVWQKAEGRFFGK